METVQNWISAEYILDTEVNIPGLFDAAQQMRGVAAATDLRLANCCPALQ